MLPKPISGFHDAIAAASTLLRESATLKRTDPSENMSRWRDDRDGSESPTPEWRRPRGPESREEEVETADFGEENCRSKSRRKDPSPDDAPWWLRRGTARQAKHEDRRSASPASPSPEPTPWWMRRGTGLGWQPNGEGAPPKDEVLSGEDTPPLPKLEQDDEGSITPPLPDEESETPPLEEPEGSSVPEPLRPPRRERLLMPPQPPPDREVEGTTREGSHHP